MAEKKRYDKKYDRSINKLIVRILTSHNKN